MKTLNENEIQESIDNLTDAIMEVNDPDSQRRLVREILAHCLDHPWADADFCGSALQNIANSCPESFEYTGDDEDFEDEDEPHVTDNEK